MAKKSILSKQKIRFGHDAVKPAQDPTLEGCDFLGWNRDYKNVQEDMEIVALFKRREYTVKFLNQDGGVIQQTKVKHGQDAVAPTPPEVQGKTFIGWDTPYDNIKRDTVVNAMYSQVNNGQDTELNFYTQAPNQYGVYFMCEGVLLETLYVYEGMDAKPTCVPVKTGYTFTSWDKSLSNVKEAMVVTAQFEINHYKVQFEYNGVKSPEQAVAHGSGAVAPSVPNKSDDEYFWRWDASFDNVTGPMTIHALYHAPVEVTFLGKDDEVVEVKKVAYEGSCVPPTEPSYQDWVFDRWDGNFVGVAQDSVVRGVYKAPVTVTFLNGDGGVMKTLTVPYGGAAVPPQDDPKKSASVFIGWEEDFSHVTEDLEVHPAFDVKFYVTFMDFNGEVIETNVVDYGTTAMLSAENEGRLGDITDENGDVNKWTGRWADINAPEVVYDITAVQRDLILVPIYWSNTTKVTGSLAKDEPKVEIYDQYEHYVSCNLSTTGSLAKDEPKVEIYDQYEQYVSYNLSTTGSLAKDEPKVEIYDQYEIAQE